MSKLTKAESARINGAKSKGPKTEQGKERSRFNALRHGLAAKTVCLTEEERPMFEAMVAAYNERFRPVDTVEDDLIEQMCAAKWRQRRCWSMETAALTLQAAEDRPALDREYIQLDDMTRNTIAFMNLTEKSDFLQTLGRYEASARRAYHRALKDLRDLQAERKANLQNEPTEPEEDDEIDPEIAPRDPAHDHKPSRDREGADVRGNTNPRQPKEPHVLRDR
jgi:hypothetical protein